MRPAYPVDRVKLEDFFSAEQIAKVKSAMTDWTDILAKTGY
jgi:hypothetical protein